MKRVLALCLAAAFMAAAMGAAVPETLSLAPPAAGWADSYISFLDSSYDVFAALWPDGLGGMAFVDLDLDGTPEMLIFDQGASMTMGVHLFDLVDGTVHCVSSALDSAQNAFNGSYYSSVHVNAGFFEAFRLSRTSAGWCFWASSRPAAPAISGTRWRRMRRRRTWTSSASLAWAFTPRSWSPTR